jgi:hypothetical protein
MTMGYQLQSIQQISVHSLSESVKMPCAAICVQQEAQKECVEEKTTFPFINKKLFIALYEV